MKNSRTMYLLARARAIDKGPKKYSRFVGYALTEKELRRIFVLEGFNPAKGSIGKYIEIWEECGFVKKIAVGQEGEQVFYFVLDPTADFSLLKKIEIAYPETTETADCGVMLA